MFQSESPGKQYGIINPCDSEQKQQHSICVKFLDPPIRITCHLRHGAPEEPNNKKQMNTEVFTEYEPFLVVCVNSQIPSSNCTSVFSYESFPEA